MAGAEQPRNPVVALEEHFWIPELRDLYTGHHSAKAPAAVGPLGDVGEMRLKEMDEAGIDLQVISHVQPGAQIFDADTAVRLARAANDALNLAISAHPHRFAGFATLPTPDPPAAADELERAVVRLGFKGAMITGLTNGCFIDEQRFWCVFERAEALGVPIYVHPAIPHPAVIEAYFKDYPTMIGPLWGFTVEAATQAIRLILSGVFDRHPGLRIILGHLGQTLPYALWRLEFVHNSLAASPKLARGFADYFRSCFFITTAGNFSHAALVCCLAEIGVERVLFSVDWPYNSNLEAMRFIRTAPIGEEEKDMILRGNVRRVLKL